MLNSSLASVIFSPSLTSSARFQDLVTSSAYTLSFYKLPVVGVMVRDAEFSKKNIYPTFVRPTAPLSDEAFVFLHMLLRLQYRQVVVLSVKRDINADQFVAEFERRRVEFKIIVQRYIEVELNENLNDTLAESFEEVTSNIILLFAKKDDAVRIFANAGDLTGKGKVWIVSESAGEAHNVPNGSLGCRLGQTAFSVLRDSFSILKSAMEKVFRESEIDIFPPVECDRDSVDAEWSSIQAPALLNEICGTSTTRVHFNDQCERIGVEYDIINFHMERKQVGNMVGDLLRLDEDSIEWAGGSKPLEISLPKHLRVVTVADPPFVYTTPVGSPSQCTELGNTVVEWSVFDKIVVANNSIDTSFTFSLHLNESYGVVQAGETTGITIGGVIGELDGDTADMAIGGITINPERERIVDFSEPWLYHGIRILEKNVIIIKFFTLPIVS
uniref:ANF_receptor domain-containing protein n=1 Tax=Caenorhabditis tropicalis TaxID=1561998 RepID=A0A1I7TSS0_9PELO